MPALDEDSSSPTLRPPGPSGPTEASGENDRDKTERAPDRIPSSSAPNAANDDHRTGPEYTGALLREIREARGLSISEISDRTRISRTVLLALEEERYEDIPNARVYVRGFVRCVARELELDMDEVSRSYVPRWERWFATQSLP